MATTLVAVTLTIALPFVAVFLLRSFEYSFAAITLVALVSQVGYAGSLRGWGYLSDHFGNRPILLISMGILVAVMVAWGLVNPAPSWMVLAFVAVLHFLSGFAIGGVELTSHNILLKTAPDQGAPAYLAGMSLSKALAAGVATIGAGALWRVMGSGVVWEGANVFGWAWTLRGFHVLAFVSAAVGVAAIFALRRIHEEGGAPVVDVARAMRREVRQLSSIAGIRAFVHAVSYVVEFVASARTVEEEADVPPPPPR
ncbi:MAG: MFS transporter [Euryarchaeota archaeon]|nr:MFS transporter [Euryarchaeota archaeon]